MPMQQLAVPSSKPAGPRDPALRGRWVRRKAQETLRRFGFARTAPVCVESIAWALGVEVVEGELAGALAALTSVGARGRIRVSTANAAPERRRFSLAHELGHFVLGHGVAAVHRDDDLALASTKHVEAEANLFASELLMPEPLAGPMCEVSPVNLDAVDAVASRFSVSRLAASIRFVELASEPCAAVFSQRKLVRWVAASRTFPQGVVRGQRLDRDSLAFDYFHGRTLPGASQVVDASAWFDGTVSPTGLAELWEHTSALDALDATLSILWGKELHYF